MSARGRALLVLIAGLAGGHIGATVGGSLFKVAIGAVLTVFTCLLFGQRDTTAGGS